MGVANSNTYSVHILCYVVSDNTNHAEPLTLKAKTLRETARKP